ncbi:MAG TPA: DUF192 domain-containing protein [Candidatus Polarisedimenticolaceae bacterium]|nr:DUF192 domain-containing protein [Candidatus Polarisedimenticolaceae bacterium]
MTALLLAAALTAPQWAVAVLPSGHTFSLEVAADGPSRARGYMGRVKVGPRDGMLFIFDEDSEHSFWMKDCKVALDIVWLDRLGRVVWIAADQRPCPAQGDCPSVAPPSPARYVVEFAAGTSAAESLKAGDAIVVLSDPPLR